MSDEPQHKLWAVRPKPFSGEILSSWLSRIGEGLGLSLHEFRKLALPTVKGHGPDIDLLTDQRFFEAISSGTGLSMQDILGTAFVIDKGRIYLNSDEHKLDWVAPLDAHEDSWLQGGLPFCPSCLAADSVHYYRKRWRFGFHPVCPDHGLLATECPTCRHPYNYIRHSRTSGINVASGVMGVCRSCETRFTPATLPGLDDNALGTVTRIQERLLTALDLGWIQVANRGIVHVCLYLKGLRQLAFVFRDREFGVKAIAWVGREIGMSVPEWTRSQWTGRLEGSPPVDRAWILLMSSWLAEEWPHRFVAMAKAIGLNCLQFVSQNSSTPFWIFGSCDRSAGHRVVWSDSSRDRVGKKIARAAKEMGTSGQ